MHRMTDAEIRRYCRDDYDAIGWRMVRWVERYFQHSGRTEFPTARQVARGLRIKQSQVWDIADADNDFMLTYYPVEHIDDVPIGDWYVETT